MERGQLSARLEAILEELCRDSDVVSAPLGGERSRARGKPFRLLADLCADHAQLALAAVSRGLAIRAVAIELRAAPLIEARKLLRKWDPQHRVLLIRGDGLKLLKQVDALVIAGVGGDLAAQLLERSGDAAGASRLIVQPNRHSREVRQWARANGFHLTGERVAAEQRRLHLILSFDRKPGIDPAYRRAERESDSQARLEAELQLGPLLLKSKESTARAFLFREQARMQKLAGRRPEFEAARALLEQTFPLPAKIAGTKPKKSNK